MGFNYVGCEKKFDAMAYSMGLGSGKGEQVAGYLLDLNERLNLPTRLRDIKVKRNHIEELADLAEADFCHPNNPKPVSREDFRQLYLEAL
jgi:alcohol dehydrogenase class IV